MGTAISSDTEAIAGGVVLYVQPPTRDQCCNGKPKFNFEKPPFLSAEVVSDSQWAAFKDKVGGIVNTFLDERFAFLFLALIPFALVFKFVIPRDAGDVVAIGVFDILIFVAGTGWLGSRMWMNSANRQKDLQIRQACTEFSNSLGGKAIVEYHTEYVGFCKPKHAFKKRGIHILSAVSGGVPPIQQSMPQFMAVQVPAGVVPGTALQVMTPQGQAMQVQVPLGVGPGETFQVPLQQAVQPVVVEATVVGSTEGQDNRYGSGMQYGGVQ